MDDAARTEPGSKECFQFPERNAVPAHPGATAASTWPTHMMVGLARFQLNADAEA
jgi:hypothetical protein